MEIGNKRNKQELFEMKRMSRKRSQKQQYIKINKKENRPQKFLTITKLENSVQVRKKSRERQEERKDNMQTDGNTEREKEE